MSTKSRQAVLIAVLGVLYWTAHTMLRPLIGPYVLELGGTAGEASFALASFAVLPTLLAIPVGALTDRWGARRLLLSGALIMIGGGAVLAAPAGLTGVIISQMVIGLGTLIVWVCLQTIATLPTSEGESTDTRNARIATFSLFLAAGQALGPLLGGLLADASGYQSSFLAYTALSLIIAGLALGLRGAAGRKPAATSESRSPWTSFRHAFVLMRNPAVLSSVAVSFTSLIVLDIRNAYHPVLLSDAGLTQLQIGILLSIAAGFGFLSRPLFPVVMRRFPPSLMVGLVLGISSVTVVAVVFVPGNVPVLALLAAVNGFTLGFAQPMTLTFMADHTQEDQRGLASGLRSTANRGAQFTNPAIFGVLGIGMSLGGSFLLVGGFLLAVTTASVLAFRRSGPDPVRGGGPHS